jgi:ADP-ribose pyrophosphatase
MTSYSQYQQQHPEMFRNETGGITLLPTDTGVAYQDPYFTLLAEPVRFPDGRAGTYTRIITTDLTQGCAVLPILPDGRIVVVDHFRHSTRTWHWEIPRGFGTVGMSAEQTAADELSEEICATVTQLHYLGEVHPDTGILAGAVWLYAARIDSIGTLCDHEGIRRAEYWTVEQAEQHVRDGLMNDGFTLAALYRARLSGLL